MSRKDLFGNGDLFKEEEEPDRKDYRPPEEKFVDFELIDRLVEHYHQVNSTALRSAISAVNKICGRDDDPRREYSRTVGGIWTIIKDSNVVVPNLLITGLAAKIKDEVDHTPIGKLWYLSHVVQALYNMDCDDRFVIDIRDWSNEPERTYVTGTYLHGSKDRPLFLEIFGDFYSCGDWARYCVFTLHDNVKELGGAAEYSEFIIHQQIKSAGHSIKLSKYRMSWSKYTKSNSLGLVTYESPNRNCTFSLMPGAEIKSYEGKSSNGNVLRKLNENGEWEEIG